LGNYAIIEALIVGNNPGQNHSAPARMPRLKRKRQGLKFLSPIGHWDKMLLTTVSL
jgi:hypothetical protein